MFSRWNSSACCPIFRHSMPSFRRVFIMPHLSGFAELGLLIFAVTFFMCYQFAAPAQMLGRVFGVAMFIVLAAIDN